MLSCYNSSTQTIIFNIDLEHYNKMSLHNTVTNFSKQRNPSKQELREHISEVRFDLDQLIFQFQGHLTDSIGRLNSQENLIRSQQRLFEDQKVQIAQLRVENTQLSESLIAQFYAFQAEFTKTKHDAFMGELAEMRQAIAQCQASVRNVGISLQSQELAVQEVKQVMQLTEEETKSTLKEKIDEVVKLIVEKQRESIQQSHESAKQIVRKKVMKAMFETCGDLDSMERLQQYSEEKLKKAIGKAIASKFQKKEQILPLIEKQEGKFIIRMASEKDEQKKIGYYNVQKRPTQNERMFKPQLPPPPEVQKGINLDFPITIDVVQQSFMLKQPSQGTIEKLNMPLGYHSIQLNKDEVNQSRFIAKEISNPLISLLTTYSQSISQSFTFLQKQIDEQLKLNIIF